MIRDEADDLHRQTLGFDRVADSVHEYAILTLDADGYVQSWNPGAMHMFGFTAGEAIGQWLDLIFTPEDKAREAPAAELRQARATGSAADERWHIRQDGTRLFASGFLSALCGREGEVIGFVKIARDLTQRQRWEDALQRANDRLEERIEQRTQDIEALLNRLVLVQEEERRRLARDLHDHLGQQITALRLALASISSRPGADDARVQLARAEALAAELDHEMEFMTWQLRPAVLDDLGLPSALATFVREWSRHCGTTAEFHATDLASASLPPEFDTHLYRIVQEALNNVLKHANATHVGITLSRRADHLVLTVEDNGRGMGRPLETQRPGLGLVGMRERATYMGGTLDIESTAAGGTTVYVRVPLPVSG